MSAQEKLQSQVCFQFYTGSRLMQRMYRPYFDEWGITYPQYLVLLSLWERDHQTISEIGGPIDLDSGTLSPLLKRLEAAGLVRRQADKEDYRRVFFDLTPRAKRLQHKAEAMMQEIETTLGITAEDIAILQKVMEKVNPRE